MIIRLNDIKYHNNPLGGKADNIRKLHDLGYSVPMGFVIGEDFFMEYTEFIKHRNLKLNRSTILETEIPNDLIKQVIDSISHFQFELWAIRSSYAFEDGNLHSYAGQFDSVLCATKDNFNEGIRKCWASAFAENVEQYHSLNNLTYSPIRMNVLCQRMINPRVSGVGFSIDPILHDYKTCVIESCYGLCKLLVDGQIIPDLIKVEKDSRRITYAEVGELSVLAVVSDGQYRVIENSNPKDKLSINPFQIQEISTTLIDLEVSFDQPIDIEWCFDHNNNFYLLQCRPITT